METFLGYITKPEAKTSQHTGRTVWGIVNSSSRAASTKIAQVKAENWAFEEYTAIYYLSTEIKHLHQSLILSSLKRMTFEDVPQTLFEIIEVLAAAF